MSQRTQKSMLEAFQTSKNVDDAPASPVRAKKARALDEPPLAAGGPFAATPTKSEAAPSIEASVEALVQQQRVRFALCMLGAALAFVLGYVAGSPSSVTKQHVVQVASPAKPDKAAARDGAAQKPTDKPAARPEGRAEPAAAELAPPAAGAVPAGPAGPAESPAPSTLESALFDRANRFTIVVETISDTSEAGVDAARDIRDYLESEGFAAEASIHKGSVFVLVGAAATIGELGGLLERLKTLAGPPPASRPAEFADAYPNNIENVLPRD